MENQEITWSVGKIIKVFAVIIYALELIGGLSAIGNMGEMGGIVFLSILVAGALGFAMLYGLGEIVDRLVAIDKRLKKWGGEKTELPEDAAVVTTTMTKTSYKRKLLCVVSDSNSFY